MTTIILIVSVPVLAILFNLVDGVTFPDSLALAFGMAQFLVLLAILDRLNRENPPPGS